jgi:hypothetical protein
MPFSPLCIVFRSWSGKRYTNKMASTFLPQAKKQLLAALREFSIKTHVSPCGKPGGVT